MRFVIYVVKQWAGSRIGGVQWHLGRHALKYQMIHAWEIPYYPHLEAGDVIIGLGGPPSVVRLDEADYETRFMTFEAGFIGQAILGHVAFFGICLSHQLRAKLSHNPVEERTLEEGFTEVRLNEAGRRHWLFDGVPDVFQVYESHRDQVTEVRHDGVLLASSNSCPIQAIDWGGASVSVQFHPEVAIDDASRLSTDGAAPPGYADYVSRMFDNFFRRAAVIQ